MMRCQGRTDVSQPQGATRGRVRGVEGGVELGFKYYNVIDKVAATQLIERKLHELMKGVDSVEMKGRLVA